MDRKSYGDAPKNPKPYAFVPFAPRVRAVDVLGHDKLDLANQYSGRLLYTFKALTPVFVGGGSYALGADVGFPQERVVNPFYRVDGIPTIPGSSLKGVVRSIVEAVSPSCLTVTRVPPNLLPRNVTLAQTHRSQCGPTHACPACSMFGRMGQLGKARFSDAQTEEKAQTQLFRLAALYAPRAFRTPRVYLDKDKEKGGRFKGRKFYYHSRPAEDPRQPPVEVLRVGQLLHGQVDFENLTAAEMGLLFFAAGVDGTLVLKLGGGKPAGLGSLQVVHAELRLLKEDHYTEADAQENVYRERGLLDFIHKAVDAAATQRLFLFEQAQALADILKYPTERNAPQGMY